MHRLKLFLVESSNPISESVGTESALKRKTTDGDAPLLSRLGEIHGT